VKKITAKNGPKTALAFIGALVFIVFIIFVKVTDSQNHEINGLKTALKILEPDGKYDSNVALPEGALNFLQQTIEKSSVWLITKTNFFLPKENSPLKTDVSGCGINVATAFVVNIPGKKEKFILALSHTSMTYALYVTASDLEGKLRQIKLDRKNLKNENSFILIEEKEIPVELILRDDIRDLALFKFPEEANTPPLALKFGNSDELEPGQTVISFGRPYNLGGFILREGKINSAKRIDYPKKIYPYGYTAPKKFTPPDQITDDISEPEHYFTSNNLCSPGDSGSIVVTFRDGTPEIVGLVTSIKSPGITHSLKINSVLRQIENFFRIGR
jgi:hypothetical protein